MRRRLTQQPASRVVHRLLWAATTLALAWLFWAPPSARVLAGETASLPNEYTVKAVFLYSFGRYVEWPDSAFANAAAPFLIGIVGDDAFEGALDDIAAKKSIQGRRIEVRRFAGSGDYQAPCHILFVSHTLSPEQQAALIRKTRRTPVLLVGETPGFAENGGIANFFIDGERVRFEINVKTARQSRLRMDAKLLNLGKPVGAQHSTASSN